MMNITISGAAGIGKTTLAHKIIELLNNEGCSVELIDGDDGLHNVRGDLHPVRLPYSDELAPASIKITTTNRRK